MGRTVDIDIGGTFTDVVLMNEDGSITPYKSPTTPEAFIDGLMAALTEAAAGEGLDLGELLSQVDRVGHGTTVATNAFIERRGASVALLTTRGFEDTIFAQRMMGMTAGLSRAEVTDYSRRREPLPLVPSDLVFGVRERVDYKGAQITPLHEEDVRDAATRIAAADVTAVAICFLWSFKRSGHERRAAELVREILPDAYVSISSDVAPRIGEYERTATTLVNAYLGPLVEEYAETLEERLTVDSHTPHIVLLDSSGRVITPREAAHQPVKLMLSGPSGGLTASEYVGTQLGHANIVTFDMGGTSADVGLIVDGSPLSRHETEIGKYHLQIAMADISTIGAGGGSIARVEEGSYLRVGPDSAGADPGPACYGRGGELPTVTDADLVLGILDPDRFLGGRLALDMDAAEQAIRTWVAAPLGLSVYEAAAGIKRIVDARMSDLLMTTTIQRGHDPRDFTLYAFGGAGPTHATSFGLDVFDSILVPATHTVHSALGAVASDLSFRFEISEPMRIPRNGEPDTKAVDSLFSELEEKAAAALEAQGIPSDRRRFLRFVDVRFVRQTKELRIPVDGEAGELGTRRVLEDFLSGYETLYGPESIPEQAGFEFVTFSLEARGLLSRPRLAVSGDDERDAAHARLGERPVYDPTLDVQVPATIYEGERLGAGNAIWGPAVVEFSGTTLLLLNGQMATVDPHLNITIRRRKDD